jgi:death on curing protein
MREYLTKIEVVFIHDDQIRRFGGSPGLRDEGLLEAALYRPQTGYYADLIEEAAALWESLSQNHPFIDGNKRTAFGALCAFLDLNGVPLTASPREAITFLTGIYERNEFSFARLVPWLRKHTAQRRKKG